MTTLTATFRIVTPMFLAGANQASAELRAPSIKGALRFWWRALQWGSVRDVGALHLREAALFGSADGGQSKVRVRVVTQNDKIHRETPPEWTIKDKPNAWKCYSGWGVHEGKRACLTAGQEFEVEFTFRRDCTPPERTQVVEAVQVFGLVGGLGSRTRNGWGSVTLTKMDGWSRPLEVNVFREKFKALTASRAPIAPYSAFSATTAFEVGSEQATAEAAHRAAVAAYQSVKVKPYPASKEDRVELGVPRQLQKTKIKISSSLLGGRRASPVMLHVHEGVPGKAFPVILWLPSSPWHPDHELPGISGKAPKHILNSLNPRRP